MATQTKRRTTSRSKSRSTGRRVTTKRQVASNGTAPKLGKNAQYYADGELAKEHGKREAKRIVTKAQAIAERRDDRLIRLEYIFVAEGRTTEREFGSKKVEAMRREVLNRRVPRKARAKAAAPKPRKRVTTRARGAKSGSSRRTSPGRGRGATSTRARGRKRAASGRK